MTPDKVEAALGTFIEQMDILRDDFVRYQEGQKSVPFVVLRESLVAALNAYDKCSLTSALAEMERDAARLSCYQRAVNKIDDLVEYREFAKSDIHKILAALTAELQEPPHAR